MTVVLLILLVGTMVFAQGGKEGKTVVLKFSDQVNEENPHVKADYHFAELVKEKSSGSIDVQVFPNSQLGNARESLEGMQSGTIEITKVAAAALSSFCPEFSIFSLPYVFVSKDEVKAALEGEVGRIFAKSLNKAGFEILAYYDAGFRSIFNGNKPITNLSDIKGMKIRVMNDPIMIDSINALGALATPLAYSELYTALKQGVVDGAEQPPVSLYTQKFYEVSKYFSLTNHFYDLNVVVMSKRVYDNLSSDQQKIIKEAAAETQKFEWDGWKQLEDGVLDDLRAEGMVINELDLAPFQKAVMNIINDNADLMGQEIIDAALGK